MKKSTMQNILLTGVVSLAVIAAAWAAGTFVKPKQYQTSGKFDFVLKSESVWSLQWSEVELSNHPGKYLIVSRLNANPSPTVKIDEWAVTLISDATGEVGYSLGIIPEKPKTVSWETFP